MALVHHSPDRPSEARIELPALNAAELPSDHHAVGAERSPEEESWLARLDEVLAETGWPDA